MTIPTKAVSIFLLSMLMLANIYACRNSVRNVESKLASPTPPNVKPIDSSPESGRAIDANSGQNVSSGSVSSTPADPQNKPRSDRIYREIDLVWRKLARSIDLSDLQRMKFAPNDIEIRIWNLPGLYIGKTKAWVFSRKDGQWKAFAFTDPEFKGKIIKKPLDTPSTGWLKWDSYVSNDMTPTKIREALPNPAPEGDAMETIVEVRFGDDYAKNLVDQTDFLTKLFKTIKSEFFNDNQANWSKF